jgi:hypothetical protein
MCLPEHYTSRKTLIILFISLLPASLLAGTKTWTGFGGDMNWLDPLNWSGAALPSTTDDVVLDNSALPVSYQVILPDQAVVVKTVTIIPSPGRNIELILPSTNLASNAFTVTGPGYGIALGAGAIFRNASGISSGESLSIADSMIIYNGGRYIHQTRAAHATGILQILSTAPGTEKGIFDFDVPRASYTISVSNRTYGSLELHANAFGSTVNYTCTGANPLLVRGDIRIDTGVNISMDLSGAKGNVQVLGDFIQQGGQLNLASAAKDSTIFSVKGDLYQSPGALITESANGNPALELNGEQLQDVALAGNIQGRIGFRMNDSMGCALQLPLTLPWNLDLKAGSISSSAAAMLILSDSSDIITDSTQQTGSFINGPMRKLGLNASDHFLFPVGKDGYERWLELKNVSGNYTVEYIHADPSSLGKNMGSGMDHISKVEYWTVIADGNTGGNSKIELSFGSSLSGGVTDPNYLTIAKWQSGEWQTAGNSAITGNSVQGSVVSNAVDFTAGAYTLASTIDLENPLPLTTIDLKVSEISEKPYFRWIVSTPETPDYFDLYEIVDNRKIFMAETRAVAGQVEYDLSWDSSVAPGNHYFMVRMTDIYGNRYDGKTVLFKEEEKSVSVSWISSGSHDANNEFLITTERPQECYYEILSVDGGRVKSGRLELGSGKNYVSVANKIVSAGIYIMRVTGLSGKNYSLLFIKE